MVWWGSGPGSERGREGRGGKTDAGDGRASGPPAAQGGLGGGWRGRLAEVGAEIREGASRCPWFGRFGGS